MRFSLGILLLAFNPGCVMVEIHDGNGVSVSDVREVDAFDAVFDESKIDVAVSLGEVPSVTVTCDQNLQDDIWLNVDDGELTIGTGDDKFRPIEIFPHTDCSVDVVATDLVSLGASGSGDLSVRGDLPLALAELDTSGSGDLVISAPVATDTLSVWSSGSGGVQIDQVDASDLSLSASGSGDLHVLGGSAASLDLDTSGSGDVSARGLSASSARVVLSGSGDAEVNVVQKLKATLSGSGDLTVYGAPAERDIQTTGSGDVLLGD